MAKDAGSLRVLGELRGRAANAESVEDLTRRNVEVITQIEQSARDRLTPVERVIDRITAFCGNTTFVWLHVAWFGGWIVTNIVPGLRHFDPYPFQFLTLVVSLEAILLSTFILITQNRQGAVADRRNHLDLQINLLSEQETTKILLLLARVAEKVGVAGSEDSEVRAMEERAHPERLVEQIEGAIEAAGGDARATGTAGDAAESEPKENLARAA